MRSANLFFFTQPQETFEDWYQVQQNTPFEEKAEPFFVEIQQIPINYGTITDTAYQDSLYWKEQHLYGSSRLGIAKPELEVTNYTPSNASKLTTNFRNYELTNHLGNVLATIKDEKQQVSLNGTTVDYYEPIVITANDYYPFGLEMSGRNYSLSSKKYPISFNGKPDDEETGWQDYGMRMYLKKIGRFPTVDPLTQKFPWYTPYQFAGNSPIRNTDLDGAEPLDYIETWNKSNSGSLNSNTEAFTFYDVNTKQNYSVKVVHNQQGGDKYYWAAKMGADGKGVQGSSYPIGDKRHNSSEAVWQRFEPNSSVKVNQKMMYDLCDNMSKGIAVLSAGVITAPVSASSGLFGLSIEYAGMKGALSAGIQYAINNKIDIADVAGDALFAPGSGAAIGASVDIEVSKSGFGFKSIADSKNGFEASKQFVNSFAWGASFGKVGNAAGDLGSKASKAALEGTLTGVSATGAAATEKAVEKIENK